MVFQKQSNIYTSSQEAFENFSCKLFQQKPKSSCRNLKTLIFVLGHLEKKVKKIQNTPSQRLLGSKIICNENIICEILGVLYL